jgi:hypothetical protein
MAESSQFSVEVMVSVEVLHVQLLGVCVCVLTHFIQIREPQIGS